MLCSSFHSIYYLSISTNTLRGPSIRRRSMDGDDGRTFDPCSPALTYHLEHVFKCVIMDLTPFN